MDDARWCQYARHLMHASWWVPWALLSPQPKQHLYRFSHFCRVAEHRIQSYSPCCANVHPHVTHASLSRPESTTQTASRSVQPFLHSSRHNLVGHVLSPKNCRFAWGDLDPHLTYGSLGPPKSKSQATSCSVQPFLCDPL